MILATDDDREGEGIAWHICKVFHLPITTTKRIIFHEITKSAVCKAIKSPTYLDMNKVKAQQARQILDLVVGFRLSPLLWQHVSHTSKTALSAGRCQTPALRLIHDNQRDINNSPGIQKYDTTGIFTSQHLPFLLNHNYDDREKMKDFLEESILFSHRYKASPPKKVMKRPPVPFTTSGLQQKASSELHFSPKDTMRIAQKLYEGGYITYMRTDSKVYSIAFIKTAMSYITQKYGEEYILPAIHALSVRKGKANAQEAHEAIRPTSISRLSLSEKMNSREKRLYKLIWRNTIESCMAPAAYFSLRARISAPKDREYGYTSEQVEFPGWKVIGGYIKVNKVYDILLKIKPNKLLSFTQISSQLKLKELKNHYTEAGLVRLLEKKGIGRPSTFSSLISKIQERGYVHKQDIKGRRLQGIDFKLIREKGGPPNLVEEEVERVFGGERNKLVIQPTGILVLEFLLKHFGPLFCYEYTEKMEKNLDKIAKGEKLWHSLCRECHSGINLLSGKISKNIIERVFR